MDNITKPHKPGLCTIPSCIIQQTWMSLARLNKIASISWLYMTLQAQSASLQGLMGLVCLTWPGRTSQGQIKPCKVWTFLLMMWASSTSYHWFMQVMDNDHWGLRSQGRCIVLHYHGRVLILMLLLPLINLDTLSLKYFTGRLMPLSTLKSIFVCFVKLCVNMCKGRTAWTECLECLWMKGTSWIVFCSHVRLCSGTSRKFVVQKR